MSRKWPRIDGYSMTGRGTARDVKAGEGGGGGGGGVPDQPAVQEDAQILGLPDGT